MFRLKFRQLICFFIVGALSLNACGSSSSPQGFTCSEQAGLSEWNNSEKETLKKAISDGKAEYVFLVPDEVIHKEINGEEFCGYKNRQLLIGFYETKDTSQNVGRITMKLLPRLANVIAYEYRFYRFEGSGLFRGNSAGGALSLLFRFEYDAESGMHPLASFSHVGFLGEKPSWAVVLVKQKDGHSVVYAEKATPK